VTTNPPVTAVLRDPSITGSGRLRVRLGAVPAEPKPFVHPTAIVEEDVDLGARTRVWHHAHIRAGATLGTDCVVGKNVFLDAGVVVGNGVKIQNNVSVYTGVTLDDGVFVGPSVVFTNDLYPRADNADWHIVPTRVLEGASLGANATILCGVTIGRWAMVAAGALVIRDVLPNELVGGNPARRLGWVCRCGQPLAVPRDEHLVEAATCAHCGAVTEPAPPRDQEADLVSEPEG
jgi:UDP-2-acetamido-3-amino-2,3-dideoxy-glucuronate N-acetyltransferase